MANEITAAASLSASKNGASIASGSKSKSITMVGEDMVQATQVINETETQIDFGAITGNPVALQIFDMGDDALHSVKIYPGTGNDAVAVANLYSGQFMQTMNPVTNAWFAKCIANGGVTLAHVMVSAVEV